MISGCDQIKNLTGGGNKLVGIWDKQGGASFVRDYYQFKSNGSVDFGQFKNDGTREVHKDGKYKLEGNRVLIQWRYTGSKERLTPQDLENMKKWYHELNYDPDTGYLYSIIGEEFRKTT